jgi:sensor histidine kinase regulating citrate/malate metabolism
MGTLASVDTMQELFVDCDLLQAEHELIKEGLITVSATQLVVRVNRVILNLMGYRDKEQLLGTHLSEVIRSPLNAHILAAIMELMENKSIPSVSLLNTQWNRLAIP